MPYFLNPPHCEHYHAEWEDYLEHAKSVHGIYELFGNNLSHHLEVKALATISIAARLISAADELGENSGWKIMFIETLSLLFPMIELIGHARLASRISNENLGAGIEWLLDPKVPASGNNLEKIKSDNRRLTSLVNHMEVHSHGPQVRELFFIRNYFLHGLKNHKENSVSMADILNFELAQSIIPEAKNGLVIYWNQLRNDDGKQGWLSRLANADIEPLIIQGSTYFEKGYIDPFLISWIGISL